MKEYVETNVMGIREIPKNWYVTKINYFTSIRTGGTPHKENSLYWNNGTINWMSSGEVNKEFVYATNNKITKEGMLNSNANLLPINSVMMALNGQGKTKGMVAVLKVESTCNQSLAAFICDEIHLHYLYLYYFLKSRYKEIRGLVGDGLRDGISIGLLKSLRICIPPYIEQIQISTYLNRKVNEINLLIEQKEILISLLEEKRQAMITESVTKGLNPNVKMKDSGVDWIGEIPEHWEIKQIRHISTYVGSGKTPKGGSEIYPDSGVVFLRSMNVHYSGLKLEDVVYITPEINDEMKSTQVQPKDVLLNITGASIGRSCMIPVDLEKANVNQHVCIIRGAKNKIVPEFLKEVMAASFIKHQILMNQNGSSREGLNFAQVKELQFPIPLNLEEQLQIAQYISDKVLQINSLIEDIQRQIYKLKDYRQSLIYEGVTGKIDVREFKAVQ
ncbi:restriction endonuclease subunit S [Priestia megaterium]|uniref:restriction endonuclease subunit S n=1 Tax=Priestia megaterium TaxID=1404 RepID=UPI0026E43169|nr:restriction endonuclease subunit S [Priestia megaterium]MDO6848746.1 restriction endonuclease subunit S [Priestia megaterium]